MLVIVRVYFNKESELTEGVLRFHYFGNLLQSGDNLVVHGGFLHLDTDIHAELIPQRFGLHMITGTGDDTIVKHLLYTLMHGGTTDTALLRHIAERNTGILGNDFQNLTIQFVNFFHYFDKMLKFECKITTFF